MTRICENIWHGHIELKAYEKCPYCGSEAYHLVNEKVTDEDLVQIG